MQHGHPMRVKTALTRRPRTEQELNEIIAEFDRIIHDLEEHTIRLHREWLRRKKA